MTSTERSSRFPQIKDGPLIRMYLKLFGRMKVTVNDSEEVYVFLCSKHGIVFDTLQEEGDGNYKPLQCQKCLNTTAPTENSRIPDK
jgi:hypothetical protein